MKYNDDFLYFLARAEELEGLDAKIILSVDFLEKYAHDYLTSAFIGEYLAEMHRRNGRVKAAVYQKAASNWEMVSVVQEEKDRKMAREALKRAYTNYRLACRCYQKEENYAKSEEMKARADSVADDLKRMPNTMKNVAISFIFISFLFSFLFLLSPPTGFSVINVDSESTSIAGVVLAVIGVVGTVVILLRK